MSWTFEDCSSFMTATCELPVCCIFMSCIFMSCIFVSCIFMSCIFTPRYFAGPSFSCPAFSAPPLPECFASFFNISQSSMWFRDLFAVRVVGDLLQSFCQRGSRLLVCFRPFDILIEWMYTVATVANVSYADAQQQLSCSDGSRDRHKCNAIPLSVKIIYSSLFTIYR